MTTMTTVPALCRFFLTGLTAVLILAGHALAVEPPPVFNDPEVTAYVKAYAEYTDDYVAAATAAARTHDTGKLNALEPRARDLQTVAGKIALKIRPEETERFTEYLTDCAQRMTNASP